MNTARGRSAHTIRIKGVVLRVQQVLGSGSSPQESTGDRLQRHLPLSPTEQLHRILGKEKPRYHTAPILKLHLHLHSGHVGEW